MTDDQLVEIRGALHTIKRLVIGSIFLFAACLLVLGGMEYQSQQRDRRVSSISEDVDTLSSSVATVARISEAIEERYITPPPDPSGQQRLAEALRKIDEMYEAIVVNGKS